jgi:hypothetical protein
MLFWEIESTVIEVVFLPVYVVSLYLYWKRRHLYPLQQRVPQLNILMGCCWPLFMITLSPVSFVPCALAQTLQILSIPVSVSQLRRSLIYPPWHDVCRRS